MNLRFLRFYTLFNLGVVGWLYGFPSRIIAARSSEFQRLRAKEDFDIICGIGRLGCVAKRLVGFGTN